MQITIEALREKDACTAGLKAFEKHYPNGGDYQEILDCCAQKGRIDFGKWLLKAFGALDTELVIEGDVNDDNCVIIFAGKIEFKGSATIKQLIAGRSISAGNGISARDGIRAGDGISAGDGYAVFAGTRIKSDCWESKAIVTAKIKPTLLLGGFWVPAVQNGE